MDGEWAEVKSKVVHKKPKQQVVTGSAFGGKKANGKLVAGPVQQMRYGGPNAFSAAKLETVNHASTVADYDFGMEYNDDHEELKFETVSHVCAAAVAAARIDAKLS